MYERVYACEPGRTRFNRTFMELKYDNTIGIRLEIKSFNRTFMELKLFFSNKLTKTIHSFNRTFMELKC